MRIKIGFDKELAKGLGFYHGSDLRVAKVNSVFIRAGDKVEKGDMLFEIESDKEIATYYSPIRGVIVSVEYQEGEEWEYGGEEDTSLGTITIPHFAEIETDAGEVTPTKESPEEKSEIETPIEKPSHGQKITPVAKRIAEEHNIDISAIQGTGPSNRIVKEDITCAIAKKKGADSSSEEKSAGFSVTKAVPAARAYARENSISLSDIQGTGPEGIICLSDVQTYAQNPEVPPDAEAEEIISSSEMRKAIARMLDYSWRHVPHAGDTITINVEQIARFRETHNAFSASMFGLKLRFDHFFLYFAAKHLATEEFQMLNNYWDPEKEEIHVMPHVNLGIAVDAGYGLVVPVVYKAETYSFVELAHQIEERILRAKEKKLTRADYLDLTFTVNNPGALGGEEPAMIIPATRMKEKSGIRSTTMIMGLGKVIKSANGHRELKATFRFDHRIVDGRLPLTFMSRLKEWCEVETESQLLSRLV